MTFSPSFALVCCVAMLASAGCATGKAGARAEEAPPYSEVNVHVRFEDGTCSGRVIPAATACTFTSGGTSTSRPVKVINWQAKKEVACGAEATLCEVTVRCQCLEGPAKAQP